VFYWYYDTEFWMSQWYKKGTKRVNVEKEGEEENDI